MKAKETLLACALVAALAAVPLAGCASQNGSSSAASNSAASAQTSSASVKVKDAQYIMYLGTNDKDTCTPVYTQAEALEQARNVLIRHFGGYTIQEAQGGWIDGEKEYREYTLVIYLSDTTPEQVHAAADELIELFRQSSVLIQENPTRTEFYTPAK